MNSAHTSHHNSWTGVHPELLAARKLIYDPLKFECSQPVIDKESSEYGGYLFELNGVSIRFRVAKITPTKIGQFVTLWKRIGKGPIQPYDLSDPFDYFVICTPKDNNFGQFVFPKSVLYEQGIISKMNQGGKRAIRVYPSWDKPTSKQAQKSQAWQLNYFLEIPNNKQVDYARSQMLYKLCTK